MTDTPDDNKLWEKFAKNTRSYKVIDFPRYDENGKAIDKICLRTLLQDEMIKIDLEIADEVDDLFKHDSKIWNENSSIIIERYNTREANVRANHYMQKIIVYPNNREKLVFPTPGHVSKNMSIGEAAKIMNEYWKLQEGRPQFSNVSSEQFNAWVDLLAKSNREDSVSFLERLQPETQIEFTTYLVSLLSNSNQLNSSLFSQLKEYTTNISPAINPTSKKE